jgi:hypothetical protein
VTPVGRQNANVRRLSSHGAVGLRPVVVLVIAMPDSRERLLQRLFLASKPADGRRTGLGGNPYARMGSQPQGARPRVYAFHEILPNVIESFFAFSPGKQPSVRVLPLPKRRSDEKHHAPLSWSPPVWGQAFALYNPFMSLMKAKSLQRSQTIPDSACQASAGQVPCG